MELLHIHGQSGKKECDIYITDGDFVIEGDFCYLVNKEFRKGANPKDSCPIQEYLGLGKLRKRSPKQLMIFVFLAAALELVNALAAKIGDYLFFLNTDWTSYIVNIAAVLCIVQGLRLFFSKKKVVEISFLTKRFCVDETLYKEEDINRLNQIMLKLRK